MGRFPQVWLLSFVASIGMLASGAATAEAQVRPLDLRPSFGAPGAPAGTVPGAIVGHAIAPRADQRPPQAPARRPSMFAWEIEVHAGGSFAGDSKGTTTLPAAGLSFPTFNGLQTRSVRSWFFGDGAALLNSNLSGVNQSARITPLDPALKPSSVKTGSAIPFGVRVSRALTSRVRAEFAFDLLGTTGLSDAARDAAQASRSSFQSAWAARLGNLGGVTGQVVTSDFTETGGGREALVTGAVVFDLREAGRLVPYVVAGGGPLISTGDPVALTLTGDYRFVSASNTPYRQTDTAEVRFESGTVFAGLVGAGFKWPINARSGVRVDFRAIFASDPLKVLLNWNPVTIPGTPTNTIVLGGTPAIQISTNGAFQSTLGYLRASEDVEISPAEGMRPRANLTVGYYYGFSSRQVQPAPTATAQRGPRDTRFDSNRRWEVEFNVGGMLGGQPTGGTGIASFPVGTPFTTTTGQPSRYTASWMFGDGALLINQMAAGFGAIAVPDRMTPLDSVLTAANLERGGGASIGIRVSRRLTPRVRAEFAMETADESLTLSSSASTAMEATRGSFERVWNGIIATGGGVLFTNSSVRGTVTNTTPSGRQTYYTGGIEYQLTRNKRLVPFATAALGVARRSGSLPETTLTGTYQFLFVGSAPLSEQDKVRVHYSAETTEPAAAFGGGIRYFLSARHGIRAELRIHLSGNSVTTLVDATPSSVPGSPSFSISSTTNPAVVFSNTSAVRGNLSAPAVTDLTTFTGSGIATRTSLNAGYFFRF